MEIKKQLNIYNFSASIFVIFMTLFLTSCGYDENIYAMNGPAKKCFNSNYPKGFNDCKDQETYNILKLNVLKNSNTINYLITPKFLSEKNIKFGTLNNCSIIDPSNFKCDELTLKKGKASNNQIIPGLEIKKPNLSQRTDYWIREIIDEDKGNYPDFEILGAVWFANNHPDKDWEDKEKLFRIVFRKAGETNKSGVIYRIFYRTNLSNIEYLEVSYSSGPNVWDIELDPELFHINDTKDQILIIRKKEHEEVKPYYSIGGGWTMYQEDPGGKFSMAIFNPKKDTKGNFKELEQFNYYIHDCGDPEPSKEALEKARPLNLIFNNETFKDLESKYCQ